MNTILKKLIERLSSLSQKLETQAAFTDKLWAVVDKDGHQQSFMFESNGELMMSKNGIVNMGKWKYYPQANSIRIDRGQNDQILLNHGFLDDNIMVLKYDGTNNDDLLILADKKKIPDLNIIGYLELKDEQIRLKTIENRGFLIVKLNNGKHLYIENGLNKSNNNDLKNLAVSSDDVNQIAPNDGFYFDEKETYLYEIKDGKIITCAALSTYKARTMNIIIAQRIEGSYYNGDLVFSEDLNPIPDGEYDIGEWRNIKIRKGKIFGA